MGEVVGGCCVALAPLVLRGVQSFEAFLEVGDAAHEHGRYDLVLEHGTDAYIVARVVVVVQGTWHQADVLRSQEKEAALDDVGPCVCDAGRVVHAAPVRSAREQADAVDA